MARLLLPLAAFAALAPLVSAGIQFTSPAPGDKLTAGSAINIEWEEGGTGPKLTDLATYNLFLCAGGDGTLPAVSYPITTVPGQFTTGNKATGVIPTTVGEDTPKNAYYVKMVAIAKAGGELTTYSDRFSYSGMLGKWDAATKAALATIDGTKGPIAVDNTVAAAKPANAAPAAPAAPEAGDFDVEYTMQTGPTRYAPMQPVPPTKVTATNTKPLYPTSSVRIATTFLPIPDIQTTITQSQTYSVSSRANTVAAASHATDDMGKFLNRWKD